MRVGTQGQNPVIQIVGGLASLLTAGAKDFASLIGGANTERTNSLDELQVKPQQTNTHGRTVPKQGSERPRDRSSADQPASGGQTAQVQVSTVEVGSCWRVGLGDPLSASTQHAANDETSIGARDSHARSVALVSSDPLKPSDDHSELVGVRRLSTANSSDSAEPFEVVQLEQPTHRDFAMVSTDQSRQMETARIQALTTVGGEEMNFGRSADASAAPDANGPISLSANDEPKTEGKCVVGVTQSEPGISKTQQAIEIAPPNLNVPAASIRPGDLRDANLSSINSSGITTNEIRHGAGDQSGAQSGEPHRDPSGASAKAPLGVDASPRTPDQANVATANFAQMIGGQGATQPNHGLSAQVSSMKDTPSQIAMQHPNGLSETAQLANATRGELHVGIHTEAFGRVTIQTTTAGGQLSAQVSLEDPKQSAILAAHLPAIEQRITQQHGLNTTVRLAGESNSGSSSSAMGDGQRGSNAGHGFSRERPSRTLPNRDVWRPQSSTDVASTRGEVQHMPGRIHVTA